MNDFDKYGRLTKDDFTFTNETNKISDTKLATKPMTYLQDAMFRFRKNKASVTAFIIICIIALFGIVVPFCTPAEKATSFDSYYSKKTARIESLSFISLFDGGKKLEFNERTMILEYAKGVGAMFTEETPSIALKDSYGDFFQPVLKEASVDDHDQGGSTNAIYTLRVDEYISVGFINTTVTQKQLEDIMKYEEENEVSILYPLINTTDTIDAENANLWYKNGTRGAPINENGSFMNYSEDMVLVENYAKDSSGDYVYTKFSGTENAATYDVRVLYYNYFVYNNGYTPEYLFGTDTVGYPLAYRLAIAIRLSLLLSICVSLINFVIGIAVGAIGGFYGGTIDLVLERVIDVIYRIPFMVVAILFQLHLAKQVGTVPSLLFAFVLTGWIGIASITRAQFYRFKKQEYVMAAKTLGASDKRIIWKHVFPNTLGTLVTSTVLIIPGVIFSESSLSYLGIVNLGSSDSTSIGTLLSDASKVWMSYPHLMIFPAGVISLLMISFNLFGNGLRDALNPSLRGFD